MSVKHIFWGCYTERCFQCSNSHFMKIWYACGRDSSILKTSKSACDEKINTTCIIQTFKTGFVVYNVCSAFFLKRIEKSFFVIFSIRMRGCKHCFWLILYWHCGNNALYSASLLFIFIFLLTPFNTRDCYYFKSNLRLVCCCLLTCFLQKAGNLFYNLLNVKIYLSYLSTLPVLLGDSRIWW